MPATPLPPRWLRYGLSAFIVLNLSTVIFMNLPKRATNPVNALLQEQLTPQQHYQFQYASWRWQQYAHYVGLNNRWQMFGRQSRFNWWYDIRAVYSDGSRTKTVLLDLPNQGPRTFAQQKIFDLKERKFELNIYRNPVAREAYSRYLARQYPTYQGLPIQTVRWNLGVQNILPPAEAVAKQQLVEPRMYVRPMEDFDVSRSIQFVNQTQSGDGT